jgi:hypothetical protein
MSTPKSELKQLASLVVLKELYSKNADIYSIIGEFLTQYILKEKKRSFNLSEITYTFNTEYEFSIPEAVIFLSLKRISFVKGSASAYTCSIGDIELNPEIEIKSSETEKTNNAIIDSLFSYIEHKKNKPIDENEKKLITHSFCAFMLDKTNGDHYAEFISAFILSKSNDPSFIKNLNNIREAVILHAGITFNPNQKESRWKNELTIYLETEILFHAAGFNGEAYKLSTIELLKFINEINKKSGTRDILQLRYFHESKTEIDYFFKKAEQIVENNETLNPQITAMASIVNGCKDKSDVAIKKSDLIVLLKSLNIYEETRTDLFANNNKFNLINNELMASIKSDLSLESFEENLNLLNYICILRGDNKTSNLENSGHILLSGNYKTIKLSWYEKIKQNHFIPLATNTMFLTSTLWLKLNKGFGSDNFPKSFGIITKSQIALSKITNENVGKKFEELKDELRNGTLTEEQVSERIYDLRQTARKPEDITLENSDSLLRFITEDNIEKFNKQQEIFKENAKQTEQELENLKSEHSNLKISAEKTKLNFEITKRTIEIEKLESEIARKTKKINISVFVMQMILCLVIVSAISAATYLSIKNIEIINSNIGSIFDNKFIYIILIPLFLISATAIIQIFMEEKLEVFYFTKSFNKRIKHIAEKKFGGAIPSERNNLAENFSELENLKSKLADLE